LFEFMLIMAFCFIFSLLSIYQLTFLFTPSRQGLIYHYNAVLAEYFREKSETPLTYQRALLVTTITAVVYPFLYYPSILLMLTKFPRIFHPLHALTHFIAIYICTGNLESTPKVEFLLNNGAYLLISASLGHALVNALIIIHWNQTYVFTSNRSLEGILRRTR